MAFNINAQIILSGPKNLNQVTKQISSQLGKAGNIKLNLGNTKQLNNISKQLNNISTTFNKLNANLKSTRTSIAALNSSFSTSTSSITNVANAQSRLANQTGKTNTVLKQQSSLLGNIGGRFTSVARQAIAFGLISRPIYDLQRAFSGAVKDAVAFEKEIVKISQVTGNSIQQLSGLKDEINRLSTTLGASANELAETARIIAQTGRSAAEIQPILAALAKSTLAPTFGNITDTTEGLIAALGQFQLSARQSEEILGSLNQVSKEFAVEAEDLISVVRRTGGVFAQAAGDSKGTIQALQELTAIFTAVRSTTRESADTIAAGLRTIFSRIQRRSTISFLKQFGVDLEDAQGKFIGIFPAFDQLSQKLETLIKQGDALTLSAIAEELGGIRQIGKLLPAIAEFQKARDAFEAAQRGAVTGLEGDVDKALLTVSNRVDRVKQSFSELIRTLFESEGFQGAFKGLLSTTENILQTITSVVKTVEPILPLLTGLGTLKLGQAFGGFLSGGGLGKIGSAASTVTGQATAQAAQQNVQATQQNTSAVNQTNQILTRINTQIANLFTAINSSFTQNVNQLANLIQINNTGFNTLARTLASRPTTVPVGGFGGVKRSSGGRIYGFNRGGMVPGTGNGDTVPAMLEPGEFVIKKSSVESIGAGQLASMNKYANGGVVARVKDNQVGGLFLQSSGTGNAKFSIPAGGKIINGQEIDRLEGTVTTSTLQPKAAPKVAESTRDSIKDAVINSTFRTLKELKLPTPLDFDPQRAIDKTLDRIDFNTLEGYVFEGFISALTNLQLSEAEAPFDFPNLSKIGKERLKNVFDPDAAIQNVKIIEAKRTLSRDTIQDAKNSIARKTLTVAGSPLLPDSDFTITRPTGVATGPLTPEEEQEFSALDKKVQDGGVLAGKAGRRFDELRARRKNSGGGISGTDTVPALLTPGEFVFNKKAASRIGYSTLNTMNKKGVQGFNKGGFVGVQRFANGGLSGGALSFSNNSTQTQKNEQQVQQGLSDLSGAAFTATFAIQSFVSSIEDGKVTSGELFNILLLVAPTVAQLAGNLKGISAGLKKFKSDLLRSAPKTGPGGVPVLEPAGTAAARRTARGRLAKGAGVGVGLAASFVGEQVGGTTGATISGAGAGLAVGSLFGPLGAGIGALVGGITALESAIQEAAFKQASEGLKFALDSSEKKTEELQKAIINNTDASKLVAEALQKSDEVNAASVGKLDAIISQSTGGVFGNQEAGPGQAITGFFSEGFNIIGTAIQKTSFDSFRKNAEKDLSEKGLLGSVADIFTSSPFEKILNFSDARTSLASQKASDALTAAADTLNEVGDKQLKNLSTVLGARGVNLTGVNSRIEFDIALEKAGFSAEEIEQAFSGLNNVIQGLIPEYQNQIDGLKATGKITQEQADLGKRLLFRIAQGETVDENTGRSLFKVLEENFSGLIDTSSLTEQAFDALRASTIIQNLETQKLAKEINAFGIAIGQLNKDISTAFNRFNESFDRIQKLAEGGFSSTSQFDPFANVSSSTPQELQAGFNTLANEFGIQVSPLQQALLAFTNRQPEILKQAAQNISAGDSAQEGIQKAFTQVTGLGGDALFNSPAFQSIIDNLRDLSREDTGTVLQKLEEQLATGEFDALSSEVQNMVQGFSELIQSTNALRKQFDANVDFEISLQRKELAARLKNAQRIQSFDPFGQRNVFDDLNERVRTASLSGGPFSSLARIGMGESDPAALLARREELREREAQLSADPARDEAANAELRDVRKELASNTDALTLLKDDTTRLAKINQDLANIQAKRLADRQRLSRIATDEGAAEEFFSEFQAVNNLLSGRAITLEQSAQIAGLSTEELADNIQANSPDISREEALRQAEGVQAQNAREQARIVLQKNNIAEDSAQGQAIIRRFQTAFTQRGQSAKEVKLTAQGNTIIDSQNEIELKLATENTDQALKDLNASFKTLQDQIDAAVLRFQNLNNNIPQNNNQQGGQNNNQPGGQGNNPPNAAGIGGAGGAGGIASTGPVIPDTVAITSTNDVNVNVMGMDTANEAFRNEVYGAVAAQFDSMRTDTNGRPSDPSLNQQPNYAATVGSSPSSFRTV